MDDELRRRIEVEKKLKIGVEALERTEDLQAATTESKRRLLGKVIRALCRVVEPMAEQWRPIMPPPEAPLFTAEELPVRSRPLPDRVRAVCRCDGTRRRTSR